MVASSNWLPFCIRSIEKWSLLNILDKFLFFDCICFTGDISSLILILTLFIASFILLSIWSICRSMASVWSILMWWYARFSSSSELLYEMTATVSFWCVSVVDDTIFMPVFSFFLCLWCGLMFSRLECGFKSVSSRWIESLRDIFFLLNTGLSASLDG